MDSEINVLQWAKELGFVGVEEQSFCDSWKKLVPPSMRHVWRHITSHVLPTEKAAYIRKNYLYYFLESGSKVSNRSAKLQANVKNFQEYEELKQINSTQLELTHLDGLIDDECKEIEDLLRELDNTVDDNENINNREKEKLEKIKVLDIKSKSTLEEINKLKQLDNFIDRILKSPYIDNYTNNANWDKNVVEFCKALPKGQETHELLKNLRSLPVKSTSMKGEIDYRRDEKTKVLHEMRLIYLDKVIEAGSHRKSYETLLRQIHEAKERIHKEVEEQFNRNQSENLSTILEMKIKEISDSSKIVALSKLKNSWAINRDNRKTEQYMDLKMEISFIEKQMDLKREVIEASSFDPAKFMQLMMRAQKSIRDEPKARMTNIQARHQQIVRELANISCLNEEVDMFLKIPTFKFRIDAVSVNRNRTAFDESFHIAIGDHQEYKTSQNIDMCLKMNALKMETLDQLTLEVNRIKTPNVSTTSSNDTSSIEEDESTVEKKLGDYLEGVSNVISELRKVNDALAANAEYWETQPLAEGSPSCPEEYRLWRRRCEEAVNFLRSYEASKF